VRWLRLHASELKVDPARVGGFGYSAGGHLVALLGALDDAEFREDGVPDDAPSARLQAVVAGGAPCDFRTLPANSNRLAYWLGGSRAAKPEAYRLASPAAFVTSDDPPMFFFHGAGDLLVPIRSPQRMVELLASRGVTAEMYIVDGRGHIATVFDSGALERAAVFLDSHLKTAPEAAGRAVRSVATNRRAGEGTPPQDEGRAPADFEKGGTTNGQ
jgi:triacylglycerol lipase